jgi:hypothetical protein
MKLLTHTRQLTSERSYITKTRTRHARYTNEADHLAPTKGMRPCVSLSAMLYVIALHRRRDEHGVAREAVVRWSETMPSQQGLSSESTMTLALRSAKLGKNTAQRLMVPALPFVGHNRVRSRTEAANSNSVDRVIARLLKDRSNG